MPRASPGWRARWEGLVNTGFEDLRPFPVSRELALGFAIGRAVETIDVYRTGGRSRKTDRQALQHASEMLKPEVSQTDARLGEQLRQAQLMSAATDAFPEASADERLQQLRDVSQSLGKMASGGEVEPEALDALHARLTALEDVLLATHALPSDYPQ